MWYQTKKKLKHPLVEQFQSSYAVDRHLAQEDIAGSIAYASALKGVGVLSGKEALSIRKNLARLKSRMGGKKLSVEDIHTAVEVKLTGLMGAGAMKLHTGRSRNEQVALDERLYLKKEIGLIQKAVTGLQSALVKSAQKYIGVVMPGYTHLQQAQPILFSYYLMSWFFALERDKGRLADCHKRLDVCPLGSGALAGNAYRINRHKLARQLGFGGVSDNALDAVSDRDFMLETLSGGAILMTHLSRLCEDLIIWSSAEFGFVELAEGLATSSSLMPQKHNPDALELVRGKTGRVCGNLVSLLTVMKGLPTGYNKDMQEDKEPVFDTVRTAKECLQILALAVNTMRIFPARMNEDINSFIYATDLADYLVKQGVPFRQSHTIISKLVHYALSQEQPLMSLKLAKFKRFSRLFEDDVYKIFNPIKSVESKDSYGGTSTNAVNKQITTAIKLLSFKS